MGGMAERLADERIRKAIRAIARGDEDCESSIYVRLLEWGERKPEMAAQQDNYILKAARWARQRYIEFECYKGRSFDSMVVNEPEAILMDGSSDGIFDSVCAIDEPSPEALAEINELREQILDRLSTLTPRLRAAGSLLLQGFDAAGIAQELGTTVANAEMRISRVRSAMRIQLATARM